MRNSFTKHIKFLWSNAEEILIILLFATFAFNIRKIFLTKYSFLSGTYNDYLTPSIRLSDIVIILTIIIFTIKYIISQYRSRKTSSLRIYNNKINLSRFNSIFSKLNISRETVLLIIFWSWLLLSVIWAPFKEIALYKAYYVSEILVFSIIVYHFALNKVLFNKNLELAIITSGTIQSIIAVSQFVKNGALGLKIFGESIIGPSIPGVAKITLFGVKHIRAYGTFPHPNVLAGFLIIPIFIVSDILLRKLKKQSKNHDMVSHETIYPFYNIVSLIIILLVLISGFILTFSRSAYIGLVIGLFIYLLKYLKLKLLYTKQFLILGALTIFIVSSILLVSLISSNFLLSSQSLEERGLYNEVSREIIFQHPLHGVGIGQFVFEEHLLHETFQGWQYQPVHNTYLLIGSELGLIGLMIYLLLIIVMLYRKTNGAFSKSLTITYYCIIICFMSISLFDHYLWDLEQGLIIFVIPFLFLINYQHLQFYQKS